MPRAIDPELLAEAQATRSQYSGGGNLNFYEVPEDGKKHTLRVLPGKFGKSRKSWFVASAQHWSNRKAYECPDKSGSGPCPFCDYVVELRDKEKLLKEKQKKADDAGQAKIDRQIKKLGKIIGGLIPKARYLVNVLDRDEPNHIIRVARLPKTLFTPIFDVWSEAEDIDVLDVHKGHDFKCSRAKLNGLTKYSASASLSASPVAGSEEEIEKILEKRPNLENLVKQSTFEELEAALGDAVGALNEEASRASEDNKERPKSRPPVDLGEDEDKPEPKKPEAKPETKPETKPEPEPQIMKILNR